MVGESVRFGSIARMKAQPFVATLAGVVSISMLACSGTVESTSADAIARSHSGTTSEQLGGRTGSTSNLAMSRNLRSADLPQIEFPVESPRIEGPIELCLTSALRNRQWNVPEHPFRIDLGRPSFPNVERLVKATFSDVRVTLNEPCGRLNDIPTLKVLIRSANRDLYSETRSRLQRTAVTLSATLTATDGREIWAFVYEAESQAKPVSQISSLLDQVMFRGIIRNGRTPFKARPERHRHAAREFGTALDLGLREVHRALRESAEIRSFFVGPGATAESERHKAPDA